MTKMLDSGIAERIKKAIKEAGGYKTISENTGLNTRTLTRITSGETDPKLSNFLAIAEATGTSLNYLAFGVSTEQEERNMQAITFEFEKLQKAIAKYEKHEDEMDEIRDMYRKLLEKDLEEAKQQGKK